MRIDVKNWTIFYTVKNEPIYLYNQNKLTRSTISFETLPIKYFVGVKDKKISVRGVERRSFPMLPNYLKNELIKIACELYGNDEYKVMNK